MTVKFNFRQVTVQCKERGHLLSKLRQRYADLMARIPRQVRVTKRIIFKICSGLYLELKLILEWISERPSSYSANVIIGFLRNLKGFKTNSNWSVVSTNESEGTENFVTRKINSLNNELIAQRELDKKLTSELLRFKVKFFLVAL